MEILVDAHGADTAFYINSNETDAIPIFSNTLHDFILASKIKYTEIVVVCIGTDRATGDSLGPLTGSKLSSFVPLDNVTLYGTLEKPIHAKNIDSTIKSINKAHLTPLIIAVDASLGKPDRIGHLKIGKGSIKPGAGLKKNLPPIGDFFITGIVNFGGLMEALVLQTTKLSIVMKMANVISLGLYESLNRLDFNKP